ncbi:C6 transcription factor [Aspergillus sclerotioniger CBS 115572]|uniref:C6 transcription factor n=1 Tax=Aspergillus sclerotioniger CBS 115572 TaxID=1450535 RepID=A0A317X0B1_9EURO|nr:C6 transcription factor [Aspergillus sclerotioniger CBS 115572]PWY91705.1 C6 transcription factor [Aspergillus sclerotioniger CBS 115572]
MSSSRTQQTRHLDRSDRPSKRRKVAIACDDCRARKVRCDGRQPVCGPCSRRVDQSTQCVYTGELEKKRAVRNYIASLEDRIKHLESRGRPTNLREGASQCHDRPGDLQVTNVSHIHRPTVSSQNSREQSLRMKDPTDSVNAMMGAVEDERPSQGFFGSSSAASFIRQIKMAVDKKVPLPDHHNPDSLLGLAPPSSLMSTKKQRLSTVPDYVLPPRKTADGLVRVYWTFVFPLYPLVDGVHLRAEYERIWTGEALESDENMLMCTFNVIFALACQLADFIPPEEREASADAFFTRAKDLLQFNLWNAGSAALIQCLLLMAQYLQSTDSAHQCWIVAGLAIRNAQGLGLHLPQTIAFLKNPQEQQLARKIWHGCVLMDRVISMTFGRPAMISKASCGSVPLPANVDEEYIPAVSGSEVAQPANRPSVMAFYAKSLELYKILNDILLSLYSPGTDESPEDIYDFYFDKGANNGERTIFELDQALTKWSRSLPSHLRGESCSGGEFTVFYHQSVVLRARFLHVRMLLFRPILSRYCTSRESGISDPMISFRDSFPQRVALQCSIICVKVAQEVIGLIHGNLPADGSSGPLPAWWYNILYVYTAATVLIAGRLCPAVLDEVTEAAMSQSWDSALGVLRRYHSHSTSARRCVAALEILYDRVVSQGPPNDHPINPFHNGSAPNDLGDLSLGEGVSSIFLEGLDLPDFQDMSWLNSVPSNLF